MREIKFRCWNTGKRHRTGMFTWEEMLDSLSEEFNPNKSLFAPFIQSDQFKERPWIILMQYIGRKDKNRKEIYEGDIIKDVIGGGIRQVTYSNEYGAGFEPWANCIEYAGRAPFVSPETECEVIGNIYENSELLKKDI